MDRDSTYSIVNLEMSKFKSSDNKQLFLLPPSLDDFVPESHLSRFIYEVVEQLHTAEIENKYSELGQKSYHPKLLLRILFYGYCNGVVSGRKIAQACESDTAYMYLANMYKPDFRTINDFRKNNISIIANYFTFILNICQQLGMAKAGTLIIDSVKIRANASMRKTKTKAEHEKWLAHLESEIKQQLDAAIKTDELEDRLYGDQRGDELPVSLRQKQKLATKIRNAIKELNNDADKVNLTDQDAKFIQDKSIRQLNYNCQTAITPDRIIVSAHATNQASDKPELLNTIHFAEQNSNSKFINILADRGYSSYDNYEQLERENKIAFIPDQEYAKGKEENPYHRSHFIYNEIENTFTCPQGQKLKYTGTTKKDKHKQQSKVYIAYHCPQCAVQHLCTKGNYRQLHVELREHFREKVRRRLNSATGKAIYKKRLHSIESIFGNIKHNLKIKQFQLRNIQKVDTEFKIHCMMHNIKMMFKQKYQIQRV